MLAEVWERPESVLISCKLQMSKAEDIVLAKRVNRILSRCLAGLPESL
jgi:hypothetical protein